MGVIMKLFIVAVPFFDAEQSVVAYELRYQSCEKLFGLNQSFEQIDDMLSSTGLDLLDMVGLEAFTGGKPIFIPVNRFILLTNFQKSLSIPPDKLVCIITEEVPIESTYLNKCKKLKNAGYRIAIKGLKYNATTMPLFQIADYYIVDTSSKESLVEVMPTRTSNPNIQIVFIKISSKDSFDSIKAVPSSLFEGKFYNQPVTKGVKKLSPLKVSSLELLNLAEQDDFDITAASKIIERDPSLSISLLRFINSPAVGVVEKINSIAHAVTMLGQLETVKWIKVAVSMYMAEDKPNEITKLSLTRARFAENLAGPFNLIHSASSLFLTGLFSLVDIVLDMTMDKALDSIAVNQDIRDALVLHKGKYIDVLNFIYAYEQSDWEKCSYILVLKDIKVDDINKSYMESLFWYRGILSSIENT
jgi:EAL and modified HD-GYP domain-containing signal transduction protein